jgi:hypothetical protein
MEQARLAERPSLTLKRCYPVAPEEGWRARVDPQALVNVEDFLKEE